MHHGKPHTDQKGHSLIKQWENLQHYQEPVLGKIGTAYSGTSSWQSGWDHQTHFFLTELRTKKIKQGKCAAMTSDSFCLKKLFCQAACTAGFHCTLKLNICLHGACLTYHIQDVFHQGYSLPLMCNFGSGTTFTMKVSYIWQQTYYSSKHK